MATGLARARGLIQNAYTRFIKAESASGLVLMAMAVLAIAWANSPWQHLYHGIWERHFTVQIGTLVLDKNVLHWINDGLMAIFFLLVGLEIKREALHGELRSPSQALMPLGTALGGMLVPALIFTLFNLGPGTESRGWGIPMATDIAFALGVLSLVGGRVPLALKVLLTALAIVDDLGAVVVIAVFYTDQLNFVYLGLSLALWAGLMVASLARLRWLPLYLLIGFGVWFFMLKSGVHATIAGVLVALTIPASAGLKRTRFTQRAQDLLPSCDHTDITVRQEALYELELLIKKVQSPLERLEHALRTPVLFIIMPIFALANAGVSLNGQALTQSLTSPVALGIALGLLLGKQLGIWGAAWLMVRTGLTRLPHGANWRMVHGVACLGGIGFTMSLFVADLAYTATPYLSTAKVGILMGTLLSALLGVMVLKNSTRLAVPAKGSTHPKEMAEEAVSVNS